MESHDHSPLIREREVKRIYEEFKEFKDLVKSTYE